MPSRVRAILYGEARRELVEQLSESIKHLVTGGCTHIILACNTSHAFLDEVSALIPNESRRVVDIIDLLANDASDVGVDKAFLLASEGTIASNIYQDRFEKRGIEIISPDESIQIRLRSYIEAVKQGKNGSDIKVDFARFLQELGTSNVILGCTELPLLLDGAVAGVCPLDPMQAAIDYLVRERSWAPSGFRLNFSLVDKRYVEYFCQG